MMEQKKTEFESDLWLEDEEILSRGIQKSLIENYRRAHYQKSFGVPTWYPSIKDYTFRSSILDLEEDEKISLSTFLDKRSAKDKETLLNLQNKIDQLLLKEFPNGAFVKLNTRSPKDVPIYDMSNEKLWKMIQDDIESIPESVNDLNHQVWSFIKSTTRIMKIECGSDAIDLLSRSTRIQEDIRKMLPFKNDFPVQLILREWLPECPERPEYEFRGFVYKKQLNALSMYFCCAYSKELHDNKEKIRDLILDFFNRVKELIPHQNYIIDFYVTKNMEVKVVELNPFHIGAGACLFSWKNDRELFMNGPFTFKIIEEPNPEITKEIIPIRWKKMIDAKYQPKAPELEPQEKKEEETCLIS